MKPLRRALLTLGSLVLTPANVSVARAAELRIAIQQAQAGDARKYQGLLDYLSKKGIAAKFVTVPDYQSAGTLFAGGAADLMFAGSGIAATMMVKGLATPLVRANAADGANTYSAVVIAPKGTPRFDGTAAWFTGRKVIFAPLASAGEFFFRSLGEPRAAAQLKAASHGAALDALARGQADVAVVKNHVWAKERERYARLDQVGIDSGANPDNVLIASTRLEAVEAKRLAAVRLALGGDASPEAAAAREALRIKGYLESTPKDFEHTLALLKKAGVTRDFALKF